MQKPQHRMSFDRFLHLGMRALRKGDARRAAEIFHHFKDLRPSDPRGYFGLAQLEKYQWAFQRAHRLTRKALILQPNNLRCYISHATACSDDLELQEALRMMARALVIHPLNHDLRTHFGLLHLCAGDWRHGFALYDDRGSRRALLRQLKKFNIAPWRGEPLDGKHILLAAEQGAGDVLQFVRYVAPLAEQGAKVTVVCQKNLRDLIAQVAGVHAVGATISGDTSYGEALMTLPRHLHVTSRDVKLNQPYLVAPPAIEVLPATDKPRVGISWTGNPAHSENRKRSVPVAELAPLFALAGIEFYSFQFDRDTAKDKLFADEVIDLAPRLGDFAQTASYVKQMDLIVTIDSSLAHLAGGLGHPVWLMLARQTDWRWIGDVHTTPWYPSMRLFRQTTAGDWTPVLERIAAALQTLCTTPHAAP